MVKDGNAGAEKKYRDSIIIPADEIARGAVNRFPRPAVLDHMIRVT
jgi:hypothetical protein